MQKDQEKSKILRLIFLGGFIVPILLMPSNFVFDELWTIQNFLPLGIGQILTDLSLPNNHPLNTLMMKIMSSFSGLPLILRLPSLICGAMIPVFCGELAWRWSRSNRRTALISAALLAMFSVPLAVFAGICRGYALQLFFLLLCVLSMTEVRENPKKAAVLTVIGAVGTFLSVPNGALFLLPAGIGYLLFSEAKERRCREMWIAAGVIAVLAGIFYGINFSAVREAQIWGTKIVSFAGFWEFVKKTMLALVLVPPFLLTLPVWVSSWKRGAAGGLLLLPILLAVFSNAGPERCYLYLAAALAVAGGIGIAELSEKFPAKKRQWIALAAVVVLAAGALAMQLRFWKTVDYAAIFEKNMQEIPVGIVPVYRASAGYPIVCVTDQNELNEFNARIFAGEISQIAFLECADREFNGLDALGGEAVVKGETSGKAADFGGLECRIYDLYKENTIPGKGDYLLISFEKNITAELEKHGNVLRLNPWISKSGVLLFQSTGAVDVPYGVRIYRIAGRHE